VPNILSSKKDSMMRRFVNQAFKAYYKLRMSQVERMMRYPIETQEKIFKQLILKAKHTEWGKKYHYQEIKNVFQFAERLPIVNYDDVKLDILRMMYGERDVLWPGRVRWFSKSSGTTNDRSKFIPVSDENLDRCHLRGSWDAMTFLYNQRPDARIFELKTLIMAGSLQRFQHYSSTRIGDVSAIMVSRMPRMGIPFFAPDFQTALLEDFEEKIERTAQITSQIKDIVAIGGVPTWVMVLFRRVLEITGKDNIIEVWPNFQFYIHGGVSFLPYREQFQRFLPAEQVSYQEVYNASEGYFGVQNDFSTNDMLLLLDNGVFYEFLPMEEWEKEHPKAIQLGQVEVGKIYAIVISTNAGLWRYLPGDTVVFTSLTPYKFNIVGRITQFINTFGEELIVANADKALAQTCQQTGVIALEYSAAPIFMGEGKGGHEWFIEFEQIPKDIKQFTELLDQNLQVINSDYEAKRYKNMALQRLTVHPLPKGTFVNWLKSKGKYSSQVKVPRLANHRDYVEDLHSFLTEKQYFN
jgi:hypothetical protein